MRDFFVADLAAADFPAPDFPDFAREGADIMLAHILCAKSEIGIENGFGNFAQGGKGRTNDQIDLLHVGSTIPRKRIDVLLKVFSGVREVLPSARLLHVGGAFTAEQTEILTELRLHESVLVLPKVGRDILASLYRRAALVLLPSEREGFGLPVVEAMACGTPVVASDLDVLREVGGSAATYCPVGEAAAWSKRVTEMLRLRCTDERQWDKLRTAGIMQAAKFTWSEYASRMVNLYKSLDTSGGSH